MHWLFKNHLGNILHYFKYLFEHKIDMPCLTKTTVTHLNDLIRFAVVQLLVLAPSYKIKQRSIFKQVMYWCTKIQDILYEHCKKYSRESLKQFKENEIEYLFVTCFCWYGNQKITISQECKRFSCDFSILKIKLEVLFRQITKCFNNYGRQNISTMKT